MKNLLNTILISCVLIITACSSNTETTQDIQTSNVVSETAASQSLASKKMPIAETKTSTTPAVPATKPTTISKEKEAFLKKQAIESKVETKAISKTNNTTLKTKTNKSATIKSGNKEIKNPAPLIRNRKDLQKQIDLNKAKAAAQKENKPFIKPNESNGKPTLEPTKAVSKPTTRPTSAATIDLNINKPAVVKPQNGKRPALSHELWESLLQKYVTSTGVVNYAGMKKNQLKLNAYLKLLQDNRPQSSWSKNKTMAYWVNVYNAFTVKLIVDNYPISSIQKLENGKPWDKRWIKIGGELYSLNHIENKILRPNYKDARIHFAVNCAAKSCPPLLNHAWTEGNIQKYYNTQAKSFINNTNYNKISADKVQISKIFEWYAVDFGNIITYLNKFSKVKINPNAKVEYLDYNWELNK